MEHCAFGNSLHQHKAQGADSPSTPTPRPRGRRTRLTSSFTRAACPPTPRMHRPRSPSYLGDDAECPVEGPGQALLRCSAFSTGRNPTSTSVADRKAFRSNLTGILHIICVGAISISERKLFSTTLKKQQRAQHTHHQQE